MVRTNRQILLHQLPQGKLALEHFRLNEAPAPTPGEGEVLVRTRYVALDAANRAWMLGATYRAALSAGQVMAGASMVEVVESRSPDFAPGDLAYTDAAGWQDYAVLPAVRLRKLAPIEPLTYLLNVYGVAGLTAYFGLLDVGKKWPTSLSTVPQAFFAALLPAAAHVDAASSRADRMDNLRTL